MLPAGVCAQAAGKPRLLPPRPQPGPSPALLQDLLCYAVSLLRQARSLPTRRPIQLPPWAAGAAVQGARPSACLPPEPAPPACLPRRPPSRTPSSAPPAWAPRASRRRWRRRAWAAPRRAAQRLSPARRRRPSGSGAARRTTTMRMQRWAGRGSWSSGLGRAGLRAAAAAGARSVLGNCGARHAPPVQALAASAQPILHEILARRAGAACWEICPVDGACLLL